MDARGKISLLGAAAAFAVAVLGGAAAFACTNLATLSAGTPTAEPGGPVTVTGASFAAPAEGAAASPVVFHWSKADGPVLATFVPDASGAVTGTFNVPEAAAPGHYVVVATQVDDKGENQFGTPARMPLEIVGPTGQSAPAVTQPATSSSSSSDANSVPLALVAVLGVMAIAVFAAGLASIQNERGRRGRPAVAPTPDVEPNPERGSSHSHQT